MHRDDFIDRLSFEVDALMPRAKAALFWLLGSSLSDALEAPNAWAAWIEEARSQGLQFVTTGDVGATASNLWVEAQQPTSEDDSQLLHSVIICLSTPLGIAIDPALRVGPWVEHAIFPLMQKESLAMYGDIAFPDSEDDLDAVFGSIAVQRAVEACVAVVERLGSNPEPSSADLHDLASTAAKLVP